MIPSSFLDPDFTSTVFYLPLPSSRNSCKNPEMQKEAGRVSTAGEEGQSGKRGRAW